MANKTVKFITRIKNLRMVIKPSKHGSPGITAQFDGFELTTDKKEIIEGIKKSPMYGVDIFGEEAGE